LPEASGTLCLDWCCKDEGKSCYRACWRKNRSEKGEAVTPERGEGEGPCGLGSRSSSSCERRKRKNQRNEERKKGNEEERGSVHAPYAPNRQVEKKRR